MSRLPIPHMIDELDQQIDNLQAADAYVEDGDTATRTYTEGQFILWKGLLYTVKTGGLPQGETISATYLDPVTGGGLNALSEKINDISNVDIGTYTVVMQCFLVNGFKRFWYYWKSTQGTNYTVTINSIVKSGVGTSMPTNLNIVSNASYVVFYTTEASFNTNEFYDFNITVTK